MRLPLAVLLVLGAAGCNRQAPGNDAGGGQGAGVAMRPGMWETQMRIVSVEAPNAPAEVVDALRANIPAAPPAERNCMTPAEAAPRPPPSGTAARAKIPAMIARSGTPSLRTAGSG